MTEAEYRALTLTENLIRSDLAPIEQVDGVDEFAKLNPGLSNKELAERVSLNPSVVTRLRAIAACPIAHAALAEGRLKGISDAYTVAKAPDAQKAELLALRASGASRDQIDQAARKQRKAATPQVRAKRVVCPLPSGVSVTVSGPELSLEDLIEALGEAQKEAKKAREQNLDVKTWQRVMHDKSRAG